MWLFLTIAIILMLWSLDSNKLKLVFSYVKIKYQQLFVAKDSTLTLSANHNYLIVKGSFNGLDEGTFNVPIMNSLVNYSISAWYIGCTDDKILIPVMRCIDSYAGLDITPDMLGVDSITVQVKNKCTNAKIGENNITGTRSIAVEVENIINLFKERNIASLFKGSSSHRMNDQPIDEADEQS